MPVYGKTGKGNGFLFDKVFYFFIIHPLPKKGIHIFGRVRMIAPHDDDAVTCRTDWDIEAGIVGKPPTDSKPKATAFLWLFRSGLNGNEMF